MSLTFSTKYITALNKEMTWKLHGPEFGKDKVQKVIVVTALYGPESAEVGF